MDAGQQASGIPETLTTERLTLRRPRAADAAAVFTGFASDSQVTRWLSWPRHRSLDDTHAFVRWSDQVWTEHEVGPYLIIDHSGHVVGSTGLDLETPSRAATGYVLSRSMWGRGLATEVVAAIAELADSVGVVRLYALCHPDNVASANVLAKNDFVREGLLRRHTVFPNLNPRLPQDVECWARIC